MFTYLGSVAGLSSYHKFALIEPLYPKVVSFVELNLIVDRLMFMETSTMEARLRTVFIKKKLKN